MSSLRVDVTEDEFVKYLWLTKEEKDAVLADFRNGKPNMLQRTSAFGKMLGMGTAKPGLRNILQELIPDIDTLRRWTVDQDEIA